MSAWTGLAPRKQVTVVLATLAIFAAVLWLSRVATQPRMELLYAGLEPASAADVVAALDQQGARYEVRGDSIYAAAPDRDALRMTLAGQGLPANGVAGYELLDGLSGFGTTAQMFDAAYWRAKEGELARTITASPVIRAARVHIANPASQPFRRGAKATASVFVTPAGSSLGGDQALALKHLVAAAVSGLDHSDVSIIDSASGTVIDGLAGGNGAMLDTEHATQLEASVQRLLEARVGPGRAVVEIAVEPQTDREQIVERRFDPESRVAISNETETRSSSSRGPAQGNVTVASEVPDGDANAGGQDQTTQDTESRERTNFEVSETQREILREPGGIKRLTVAVLVDGTRETGPDGTEEFQPRSEEELLDLRELVASAVGYDETRGDVITIKSLAFEELPPGSEGSGPASAFPLDVMQIIQIGVLALVALALGLFVVRPILTSGAGGGGAAEALPAPGTTAIAVPDPPGRPGQLDAGGFSGPTINTVSDFDVDFPDTGMDAGGMPAIQAHDGDPVARLRHMIEDRKDETLEVLRGWMSEDKERTG